MTRHEIINRCIFMKANDVTEYSTFLDDVRGLCHCTTEVI